MKKLIILLLFVPILGIGQDIKKVPRGAINNSRATGRINQTVDTVNALKAIYGTDGVASLYSLATDAITYTDTYWDDLRVPLSNTKINPAQSEPDYEDNGTGAFSWGFDPDSDSAYVLNFETQIPHSYVVGTDLEAHIHWLPPTTNTGSVRWKLTYWYAAYGDAVAGPFYLWVTQAGSGTAHEHQIADLGEIPGTTLGISAMIWGKLARLGDHADDTYTGSAYAVEIDFHFQLDQPGSAQEYEK